MALPTRNPPGNLADHLNRPSELFPSDVASADPCSLLPPSTCDELKCPHQGIPLHYQQHAIQPVVGAAMASNLMMLKPQWPATPAPGQRKRKKGSINACAAAKRPSLQQVHQKLSTLPSVLQAEDDRSTVSNSRPNLGALLHPTMLSDGLSAQISKQQDDIMELLTVQAEQLRLAVEERAHRHSKTFLANIGQWVSRKLRDRNAELERVNQKNLQLEEKVNYLSLEIRAWQSRAWSFDAMVTVLRANLQQVLCQQQRHQAEMEGCGDSEQDAASAIVGTKDVPPTWIGLASTPTTSMAVERACKKCKSKEPSVLLLPCLHLSVCRDCKEGMERCPSCNCQIGELVEVYLS